MLTFTSFMKNVEQDDTKTIRPTKESIRFREADQIHDSSTEDHTDIKTRARLYRRELLYETISPVRSIDKRTINVILPMSRHQLNVSTLTDLYYQLENITNISVSYKLTTTSDIHGKQVHRLPAHRSTVYVHELCSDCDGPDEHGTY
jgi:hypothetical protein